MSECKHEYVDRIITTRPAWSEFTKLIIYCKNCGHIALDEYV